MSLWNKNSCVINMLKNRKDARALDENKQHTACDECGQCILNKSNSSQHNRHVYIMEKKEEPICRLCCQIFSKKSNLKRHIARFHSDKEITSKIKVREKVICEECGASFSEKSNLTRHKTRFHTGFKNIHQFECDLCGGKFQWKKMWIEHMITSHNIVIDKRIYMRESCEKCGQSFHNRRNLLRHEKSIHEAIIFECDSCDKIFRRKDSLTTHKLRAHCINPDALKKFECYHCSKKFFEKHLVKRHILSVHMSPKRKSSNVKCMQCKFTCSSRLIARAHYEKIHEVKLDFEQIQFESMEEFELWRTEMQRTFVTQFVQQSTGKTLNGSFKRFVCHRSGIYKDLSKYQPRKRQLKNSGSKKIQGFCPAEIVLKIQADKCLVQFQRTHVGHTIASEEEMRHIYLDKEFKKTIASKLLEGTSKSELLETYHVSEKLDRLHKLKSRDIWNINQNLRVSNGKSVSSRKFVASVESVEKVLSTESLVIRKDSILFSKNQGEEDTRFGLLESSDFIMIMMDQSQAETLQRYGFRIVAFDSTQRINSLNFIIHSLLVLDVNCEVVPVAFLLTNRNDGLIIDIFIRCIRDRVGIIRSKTLMSDMQNVYLDCWTSLMEPPQFYQFCARHVHEFWRQNLDKISDENKRASVYRKLLGMEQELDTVSFEQKLSAFVSLSENDDSLINFLNFFKNYFYDSAKQWAYCYRVLAGVPVSMRVEDVFKPNASEDTDIKTTFEGLKYLEEFSITKDSNEKIDKAERSDKREILKRNHRLSVQSCETNVASLAQIDDRTWQIVSFEGITGNETKIYSLQKLEKKECSLYDDTVCQLYCEECEICFHEYRCSCVESVLHLNMCTHFHVLGLYLQTHRLLEIKESSPSDCCEAENSLFGIENESPVEAACVNEKKFTDNDLAQVGSFIIEEIQEVIPFTKELNDLELL